MKKEKYGYKDDASDDMLVRLLLTCDGRGVKEKSDALKKLLERYPDNMSEVEAAIASRKIP